MTMLPMAGYDYVDDSYSLALRTLPDGGRELLAFRVDLMSRIRQMRRLPVTGIDAEAALMVIADGSIFVMEPEPDDPEPPQRIRRFAPDGSEAVVWQELDSLFPAQLIGAERRMVVF